jgi:hypothetical protein
MSELVQAYEKPNGKLDVDNASALGNEVVDAVTESQVGAPIEVSNDLVDSLARLGGIKPQDEDVADAASNPESVDAGAGTPTVAGNKIDVAASAKIHRICRGWNNRIDEAKNGFAELTVTFDRRGLIPTIWGQLAHCRFKRGITSVELDGVIQIHFGTNQPRIGLRALRSVGYLVEFDGSAMALRDDGTERHADVSANFRVFLNGVVQVNVNMADGTNVLAVFASDTLRPAGTLPTMISAGIVTRDAKWACDINAMAATGECTNQSDPNAAVLRW